MKRFFKRQKPNFFSRLKEKRHAFIRKEGFCSKNALNFLNISQFLGAVNDNVFKFLTVFLLIDLKGVENSSEILFWVGTVYVLPFLLFSQAAGILADKMSKQKLIVALKALEVVITILGVFAFAFESAWACYSLLFLLSFQSAAFGPPKYSIIPEIVPVAKISKANGMITSFTYLAIIAGTFIASFSAQITDKDFVLSSSVCVVIAIIGLVASLLLPYTPASRTTKKMKSFFLKEVYETLRYCYKNPHLLLSVLSAGFFLYIGAYFQLNVIPYAIESLNLSEVSGGYLFLTVAIGIAIGAIVAGKLSRQQVELGLSAFAIIFLGLTLFLLYILPKILIINIIIFILIGFFGGLFIVPFESYIQTFSPDKKRGQIVATSNFVSFTGVLFAPMSLYLFSGYWQLKSSSGFFIISLITLTIGSYIFIKLFPMALQFLMRKIISKIYTVDSFDKDKPFVLYAKDFSFKTFLTLCYTTSDIKMYIMPFTHCNFYRLLRLCHLAKLIRNPIDLKIFLERSLNLDRFPCLLSTNENLPHEYTSILSTYDVKQISFTEEKTESDDTHWKLHLQSL